MRNILFVVLLGMSLNTVASENYCHDKEKINEWEGIIGKYSETPLLVKLYAMRIGLCQAVDEGKIDIDTAIDVFEMEREKLDTKTSKIFI